MGSYFSTKMPCTNWTVCNEEKKREITQDIITNPKLLHSSFFSFFSPPPLFSRCVGWSVDEFFCSCLKEAGPEQASLQHSKILALICQGLLYFYYFRDDGTRSSPSFSQYFRPLFHFLFK